MNNSNDRPHWADRIMAVFTVLIFLTYITSDYFLWRQLNITQGQLDQMDRLSQLDQRAWVGFSESTDLVLKAGQVPTVTHWFINTGKTPAIEFGGRVDSVTLAPGEDFTPNYHPIVGSRGPSKVLVMPNQKQFFKVVASTEATSQLAIDKLTSGKRILYVFGEVCYKDIFHHPHHTTFCESISPDLKTFQNCQTYNEADDEPHDCK